MTDCLDGYLKDHDNLRGLIIVTEKFPGWESFKAYATHLKMVRHFTSTDLEKAKTCVANFG